MQTIFYVDEFLLRLAGDFCLDFFLLWATAQVTRAKTTRGRLFFAALLGASYAALVFVAQWGLLPGYGFLNSFVVKIGVSLLMVTISFAPIPSRRFFSLVAYFYLLAIVTSGAALLAWYLSGGSEWVKYIVAFTTIFVIAELGWGVIHRLIWQELLHIPLVVTLNGKRVELVAMLDTANHLRDPLTGTPVIIVEAPALRPLLSPEFIAILRRKPAVDLTALLPSLEEDMAARIRVLPYSSIGRDHGILIGFRPDAVYLKQKGRELLVEDVIIGVYQRHFRPAGEYRALIHPELLEGALAKV